jgi:hypothetical protein
MGKEMSGSFCPNIGDFELWFSLNNTCAYAQWGFIGILSLPNPLNSRKARGVGSGAWNALVFRFDNHYHTVHMHDFYIPLDHNTLLFNMPIPTKISSHTNWVNFNWCPTPTPNILGDQYVFCNKGLVVWMGQSDSSIAGLYVIWHSQISLYEAHALTLVHVQRVKPEQSLLIHLIFLFRSVVMVRVCYTPPQARLSQWFIHQCLQHLVNESRLLALGD